MNTLTRWTNPERLTSLMEKSDQVVQLAIANALLKNSIVINGEMVNVRRYVKNLPEFRDYIKNNKDNLGRLNEIKKEIENRIKEEIKTNGVLEKSNVVDGKLVIDGLTDEDGAIQYFTNTVQYYSQKVTGMNPEWNAIGYKTSMLGRLTSTYRTWIPNTVAARFGKMKWNAQIQDYQWGKHLALWDAARQNYQQNAYKAAATVLGFTAKTDLINFAMAKYNELRQEMEENGKVIGDEFMDENEFIDMYMSNVNNTVNELRVAFGTLLLLSLGLFGGADGDDDRTKSLKKFARFQFDRMNDEFLFYYNPSSLTSILKTAVPAVSYLETMTRAIGSIPKEFFDEDNSNNLIKNLLAPIPVASEFLRFMPLIDPETAKDMGIKQASVNNFIN
jgi:hypothetical protein